MTVYVTAVSPGQAKQHENITGIRWLDSNNSTSRTMSVAQAVEWMRGGNKLVVAGKDGPVAVQVVQAVPPYIRTVANGDWSDNLLALPRY